MSEIPKTMRAVRLYNYDGGKTLKVEEVPVPVPREGELLVRVEASAVNPSDTAFLAGQYSAVRDTPCTPGFEGSGVVVASGGGLGGIYGWWMSGKRVAFALQATREGCWAEYAIVPQFNAVALDKAVSLDQGSCSVVNPLTALSFLEVAQTGGHTSCVHTPGASALGRMTSRLLRSNGITVINLVRRAAQKETLVGDGSAAEDVIVTSDDGWLDTLKARCKALKCRLAFDAVAGDQTGDILGALCKRGEVHVYGALSLKPSGHLSAKDLIFQGKSVHGLWLTQRLMAKSVVEKMRFTASAQKLLTGELSTTFSKRVTLEEIVEGVQFYKDNMSAGKVLIKPQERKESE